jgi:hypothetical protein
MCQKNALGTNVSLAEKLFRAEITIAQNARLAYVSTAEPNCSGKLKYHI